MTTTIEIDGYLERKLDLLVGLGLYATKSEAVRDAIRRLLEQTDVTKIALDMYLKGMVSLGFCCEIADLSCDEMLALLQRRGLKPKLGVESLGELETELNAIEATDSLVFEALPLTVLGRCVKLDFISSLAKTFYISEFQLGELPFDIRRSVLVLLSDDQDKFSLVKGIKGIEEFAVKNGVSMGEASAILSAQKLKALLVCDDQKVRDVAKISGNMVISSVSLIIYLLSSRVTSERDARSALESEFSLGYSLPLTPAELTTLTQRLKV
jgi:Arc/MetJ-type ribon-helix-helix transcriptional regulator/predicted nucleic acid-binding protein